jgi:hypothetical protein
MDYSSWSHLVAFLVLIGHPEKIPDPPPDLREVMTALAIYQTASGLSDRGVAQAIQQQALKVATTHLQHLGGAKG